MTARTPSTAGAPSEPALSQRDIRVKRLHMRSMRRGTKEMDIILIRYAAARLAQMDDAGLDAYEVLLDENDQDLYQWISGQKSAPEAHTALVADIRAVAANG